MLRFTKRSEYGFMALAYLASRPQAYCSVREIVEQLAVPKRLLAEILKDLSQAKLVESVRGPGGGYRLCGSPGDITLSELVGILEGPVQVVGCSNGGDCEMEPTCIIREGMEQVADEIHGILGRFTLGDLVTSSTLLNSAPQPIHPPAQRQET